MPERKLRLEDAEALLEDEDCGCGTDSGKRQLNEITRALIALARAAKREVRCTCKGSAQLGDHCVACGDCPDTAAELERWE